MLKKCLSILICILLLLPALPAGEPVWASGAPSGEGTWGRPYTVTDAEQLSSVLEAAGSGTVYIRLGADIVTDRRETMYAGDVLGPVYVSGSKCLDLNGFTLRSKLPFNTYRPTFSLFVIAEGASLTLEDSVGGGEIIYDRYIPNMSEANYQTDIFLDRPLTVFDVRGELTVNGGEITAGHYESEYYTYTDGYIYTSGRPSPGTVNSITSGNAVIVRDGGRFVSNGGEYYGRGFIMDEDGGKEVACAAVALEHSASALINAGDFYGKSCADVFSVDDDSEITVMSGNFYARYDSRITVNKLNGVAYYVNVDCGRIGVPLRAFDNGREAYTHIYVDSVEYNYTHYFTARDNEDFVNIGSSGTGASVTVETLEGSGTKDRPYLLKNASDIQNLMSQRRMSRVYVRLNNDIDDCLGNYTVSGNIFFDLNGHTLKGKLGFNDYHPSYTLFIIEGGSSLTVDDSVGNGEIIFDRFIPGMAQTNEQTDIFLYRALTVFAVDGNLTVNGGEITAGHYESEYYTYTKKYLTGGSTNAGSVNSITPGNAVVVRDGGRFTSNGGEYYGRGFTVDDNGEKDYVCAAVRLKNGAAAIINDGAFYGKSNADVFSVAWGANAYIYSGLFNAQYDNRITVDKMNGTAYYVNVDCGRIGLPLRAFDHSEKDRCLIRVDSEEYAFASGFTSSQSDAFENLGASGTGATVTAEPRVSGSSRIAREDGIEAGVTYSPTEHFVLVHKDAPYFSDSFAPIPESIRTMDYYWKITKLVGSAWVDAEYVPDAPVSDNCLHTDGDRLDLYDLARYLSGGMENGATYRVTAYADESWGARGNYFLCAASSEALEIDCVYERLGALSLPDSLTGIVWPVHNQKPRHVQLEQESFTASLIFEELSADGSRWAQMSERVSFCYGKSCRLRVVITPKTYYRAEADDAVVIGGRTVVDKTVSGGVLTGYIPLEVLPCPIGQVVVQGGVSEGVKLSSASPLTSAASNVSVSTVWYKNGAEVPNGSIASYGSYRARIRLETQEAYVLTDGTNVKVFGKNYLITELSSDGTVGYVYTDPQSVACTHANNTNGIFSDADCHYTVCSVCGAELKRSAHTFGAWYQNGGNDQRKCGVCGYVESVSNGKSLAPYIRLTSAAPYAGDPLPSLAICEADSVYGELDGTVEWFMDAIDASRSVTAGTVMEAGHVYYARVKVNADSAYYFTSDTEVATLNVIASSTVSVNASWEHIEAFLSFSPRTSASAQFELSRMRYGQTYGEFLSGFDAAVDGVDTEFVIALYRNDSYVAGLAYNYGTDSWWIASGNLEELMARGLEPDSDYRLLITVADTDKYFDAADVTVGNPSAASSYEIAAGNLGCTLTVRYHLSSSPMYGDANGDGDINTLDLTLLRQYLTDPETVVSAGADVDGRGGVNTLDLTLLRQFLADTSTVLGPEAGLTLRRASGSAVYNQQYIKSR